MKLTTTLGTLAAAILLTSGPALAAQGPNAAGAAAAPASSRAARPTLLRVRRVYVESFGDDAIAKQTQAMVVDALVRTNRFTVTENRDRADAVLEGAAFERSSDEVHAFSEGGSGEAAAISGRTDSPVWERVAGVAAGASAQDSQVTTEKVDDARVSVRLVDPDGDVLWSTTQESSGAKYKGASADAADKIAKQLMREIARLENGSSAP